MPPLQIRVPRTRAKNGAAGQPGTGRMHAAPTDRLAMAGKWARRVFAADGHGGVKTPPYRARKTGNKPQTPHGANPCREAYMPPLQTGRKRQVNRQGSAAAKGPNEEHPPAGVPFLGLKNRAPGGVCVKIVKLHTSAAKICATF